MKRLLSILLCVALCASLLCGAASAGQSISVNTDMRVLVNGEVFQPTNSNGDPVPILEYNGTTYAPIRALAEAYGLTVGYDQSQRMATVSESAKSMSQSVRVLSAPSTIEVNTDIKVQVNGEVFQPKDANGADVLVFEYQGTTYAPLRALAEAYGLTVGYDQDQRMATITKGDIRASVYDENEKFLSTSGSYINFVKINGKLYRVYVGGDTIAGGPFAVLSNNGTVYSQDLYGAGVLFRILQGNYTIKPNDDGNPNIAGNLFLSMSDWENYYTREITYEYIGLDSVEVINHTVNFSDSFSVHASKRSGGNYPMFNCSPEDLFVYKKYYDAELVNIPRICFELGIPEPVLYLDETTNKFVLDLDA